MRPIVYPITGCSGPLASGDDGRMPDNGNEVAVTTRLDTQNAETRLIVVKRDPLDDACKHFLARGLRLSFFHCNHSSSRATTYAPPDK